MQPPKAPIIVKIVETNEISGLGDVMLEAIGLTGVRSIQKPSTSTRCTGSASGMPHPSHPIQKVPPGTHTMPFGAGPGAAAGLMRTASDRASADATGAGT